MNSADPHPAVVSQSCPQQLTKLDVQSQREALALARHAGWPVPGDVAPEPDAKPSHVTWSGSQSMASVPLQASFDERAHECHEQ